MPPSLSQSIVIDSDSNSDAQSELSELESELFEDLNPDEECDASLSSESSPQSSPQSFEQAHKKRKVRAVNIWALARKPVGSKPLVNSKGRRYWYCGQCVFWRDVVTTNIRTHLFNAHGVVVKEEDSVIKRATQQSLQGLFHKQGELHTQQLERQKDTILRESVNPALVRDALAQLIVVRNLPYKAVTWPELRALLLTVNYTCEEALIDSDTTVPRIIEESYVLDKEVLKQKLQSSLTSIHLSLDAWTSPNRKTFIAICSHFINDTGVLRKALLALPFLPGKHGGDKQVEVLWQVLKDYQILNKVGYYVGDNHGSNDKLLRELFKRL